MDPRGRPTITVFTRSCPPPGVASLPRSLAALAFALCVAACGATDGASAPGAGDSPDTTDSLSPETSDGDTDAGSAGGTSDAAAADEDVAGPDTADPHPCSSDGDCAGYLVGETGPCRHATCDDATGACVLSDVSDQTPCDDGSACSDDTVCTAGSCGGGLSRVCDDRNPCTTDSCDPAEGCAFTDNVSPCDDGNACTDKDTCAGGVCYGNFTVACECESDADCAAHDDADLCNGSLVCSNLACVVEPGSVVTCPTPGSPCVAHTCDPASGACEEAVLDGAACTDGDPCTTADTCSGGVCEGAAITCPCVTADDCAPFEDGNACNGTLTCAAGDCVLDPTTIVTCDTSDDTVCLQTSCEPSTGACVSGLADDDMPCEDGDACTLNDTCLAGECAGGVPKYCEDTNLCTVDTCDPVSGCVHSNVDGLWCDDGDSCTVGDNCTDGSCWGSAMDCDDDKTCTEDICVEGQCENPPVTPGACGCQVDSECYDDDACTIDECDNWECTHVTQAGCCSADWQCPVEGQCVLGICEDQTCKLIPAPNIPCEDGDPCTVNDHCVSGGCAPGPPSPGCCPAGAPCGAECGDGQCTPGETCATCEEDCGPCVGDCCQAHGTPGCQDAYTTSCVCAVDDYCCGLAWDDSCVDKAADCGTCPKCGDGVCEAGETCESCQPDCGSCEGSCCAPHASPGCVDAVIQSCVCTEDDFCCNGAWDDACVAFADGCGADCPLACGDGLCDATESCDTCPGDCAPCTVCGDGFCEPGAESCEDCAFDCGPCTTCGDEMCGGDESCATCPDDCGDCSGDCCDVADGPGCDDEDTQACVCGIDPFCCEAFWDEFCVMTADGACQADCEPDGPMSDCCWPHDSVGCDDAGVQTCVCDADPFCCDNSWDALCADAAAEECDAECDAAP